ITKAAYEKIFDLFPRLKERYMQSTLTLSGGEQQMLAVARAIVTGGELIVMDEPSMGLAPKVVDEIFEVIQNLNQSGTTILLNEQNAYMALSIANRAYVLETGNITIEGPAHELLNDPRVKEAYLGG
ncbi:MAG TPA: ATP-binding cassette domain-containing protein, partial [Flexilinea sp.]|nr:ATP-binding cassette domain-containing protein [Flexilinea sp.]